jgi:hypothetical protein
MLLQPEAIGAVMEVTKWLKPLTWIPPVCQVNSGEEGRLQSYIRPVNGVYSPGLYLIIVPLLFACGLIGVCHDDVLFVLFLASPFLLVALLPDLSINAKWLPRDTGFTPFGRM